MKLKNNYEQVGQLLSEKFEQVGLHPSRVARGCGLSIMRLMWMTHGNRSRISRRELEALRVAFGDNFADALQAAAGYSTSQFAKQDKDAERQAIMLRQEVGHLREELALNEAEGDDPVLRAAVLTMLDQCDRHLDGWATYRQNNYNRAADLLAAAEHLYKAATLTYRASHPPVRPQDQWAEQPPYRHRYAVDETSHCRTAPA